MPTLSRWHVRTAMLALLAGMVLAVVRSLAGAGMLDPLVIHLITVGWLTQMVFGVAFWLFPRFSADRPRGREWLGWVGYAALNAGIVCRAIGEPAAATGRPAPAWLIASAVLQVVAVAAFVVNTWPRVEVRT
ncbi:MAG: hypothetical protein AB7L66_03945 [Gemmatimonadales bacterium]